MFDFTKKSSSAQSSFKTPVRIPASQPVISPRKPPTTALEKLWPVVEHQTQLPLRDTRYGATDVILPTYKHPVPMIIPMAREGGTTYHIFMLSQIKQTSDWSQAIADIVHILDYATETDIIVFHLASPGGVLNIAARVVAAMQRTAAHTVTRALGLVASAGSFIWSYGKERQTVPGAVLMFHMSKHGDCGHTPAIAENAIAHTAYIRAVAFNHLIHDRLLTNDEVDDIVARRREIYLSHADIQERMGAGHV